MTTTDPARAQEVAYAQIQSTELGGFGGETNPQAELTLWPATSNTPILKQTLAALVACVNTHAALAERVRELERALAESVAIAKGAIGHIEAAHESLFTQCASNPIKNAWGQEVNVRALNDAHLFATQATRALAGAPKP